MYHNKITITKKNFFGILADQHLRVTLIGQNNLNRVFPI